MLALGYGSKPLRSRNKKRRKWLNCGARHQLIFQSDTYFYVVESEKEEKKRTGD
jgi:hypothetical protein